MAQTLVNQRLNKLVKLLGITKKEFEKASGLSNGFIDKAGDSIRQDKVDKILLAYPNVNQVWLMTGEGEVFEEQATSEFARFGRVLYHLVETEQVGSPEELAVKMTPKVKELIEAKGYNRSVARAYVIEELFSDINAEYLITGEGEMLKPTAVQQVEGNGGVATQIAGNSTVEAVEDAPRIVATDVESYDVALRAGVSLTPEYSSVFFGGRGTNTEGDYVVAHWHIPNAPKDAVIIPMLGNSMSPRFSSGSRLVVRPIEFFSPMSISFGDVFAIVVQDEYGYEPATHIKILRRHTDKAKEHTHWIARSINRDEYDDFEVEISRVSKLYKVVGGVDFFEMM